MLIGTRQTMYSRQDRTFRTKKERVGVKIVEWNAQRKSWVHSPRFVFIEIRQNFFCEIVYSN